MIKFIAPSIKYRSNAHPKTFGWDWKQTNFNRLALVNYLVSKTNGWESHYLEIGCDGNSLFDSVAVKNKFGVDPVSGGNIKMTSDEFFKNNNLTFDVIFVDGLHNYQQTRRDALNSLKFIKDPGWIAFHDFLPRSWKEHHVPRLQKSWTGDCWKLAVELMAAEGLEFKIIEIDHGVGLLRKVSDKWAVPDFSSDLIDAQFDVFVEKVKTFPLISFDDAVAMVTTSP